MIPHIESSKQKFVKLVVILQYWRILGREAVFYRSKILDMKNLYLRKHCQKCRTDENLSVVLFKD